MFDFLGKKPTDNDRNQPRPKSAENSLLDVVVPFSPKRGGNGVSAPGNISHNSLLSQFDVLSQKRQLVEAEKQAVERAEMRAKKAAFERSEQLARLEVERNSSRQFEEKANELAAEIERVRQSKLRQPPQTPPEYARPDYPSQSEPSPHFYANEGMQAQSRQAPHQSGPTEHPAAPASDTRTDGEYSRAHQERAEFERFQQWQRSSKMPQQPVYDRHLPQYNSPSPPERDYRPDYADRSRGGDIHAGNVGQPHWQHGYPENQSPDPHNSAWQPEYGRHMPHPAAPTNTRNRDADNYPRPEQREPHAQPSSSGGLYGQNHASEPPVSQSGHGASQGADKRAGLDLDKIFFSILGSWKLIGFFAILGAVIAGVYAKSLPNKYEAWAELLIDPQGITLIDKQLSTTGYGGEAMIAYLESQLRIIDSTSVLNKVIDDEKLFDDPEFSEKGSPNSGLLNIINPLSGQAASARDRQIIIDNLHDKLTIARGSRTFIISIGMMTEDGEKSAKIANAIARAYVNGESGARSKIARDASENLSDKLTTLRSRVLAAEQKVADYKAENGLVTTDGKLISEVQLSRINEQLAIARIETVNARTKMEQLRSIDLSDVISGALPASLNTGTLSQFRIRYATLKSTADRLSTKLGPKHPERIAASAELESARGQISREIRRSIAGSQKDFERAKKRQEGLNQQLNTVKATAAGTGNSLIALRELERELGAHKQVYENYLLRSRETSEQEGLTTTNARVITPAAAPLQKASPNRKVIAGVGLIIGGMIGLVIALLKGMFAGRRLSGSKEPEQEGNNLQQSHQNADPMMHQPYATHPATPYGSGYYRAEPPFPNNSPHYRRPV